MTLTLTTKEIATKMRALLNEPTAWTQGEFARDALGGHILDWTDETATCFCFVGAYLKVTGAPEDALIDSKEMETRIVFNDFITEVGKSHTLCHLSDMYNFNDDPDTKHSDILEMLDKAIAS